MFPTAIRNAAWVGALLFALACARSAPVAPRTNSPAEQLRAEARKSLAPLLPAKARDDAVFRRRIELGRKLFFEPKVGIDGKTSCATCHMPDVYGAEKLAKSRGVFGRMHIHNAPTVFNSGIQVSQGWRGELVSVEAQASETLRSPVAAGNPSVEAVLKRLADAGYQPSFREAFPGDGDPLNAANFGAAVGAYERTLATPAPFDRFLEGDDTALGAQERRGLQTFLRVGCANCHGGAGVGGGRLERFGVTEEYWNATGSETDDPGRYVVTKQEADRYVFKVSSLRNVAETAPYFHDGSVATLQEAIRVMARTQFGKALTDAQVADVAAFLRALTGPKPATFAPP